MTESWNLVESSERFVGLIDMILVDYRIRLKRERERQKATSKGLRSWTVTN